MNTHKLQYQVYPIRTITGELQVPGDKSISHRSVMLGALAEGVSRIEGFLEGDDALSTIACFRALGIVIEGPINQHITIVGKGLYGLNCATHSLDAGNSGTLMRLFSGLLVGQRFSSVLIGDKSLMKRPMRRVVEPLSMMDAIIHSEPNGCAPLRIEPAPLLHGIDYTMQQASAQVKSAILLAALYAKGATTILESATTRDHTERMLARMGAEVKTTDRKLMINPLGTRVLSPLSMNIPGDLSSAAFWLVACSIMQDSNHSLLLTHVGINPTRKGVIMILQMMGAHIEILNPREVSGEPVADLYVRPAKLKGIVIQEEWVPLSIDEFPILFIAAAAAEGTTKLTGAAELRVKESDRLKSMADGLSVIGVHHKLLPDGIIIEGQTSWRGGTIESHGDHRIAMSFTVAALRANDLIAINDCGNVATSYPNFVRDATTLGFKLEQRSLSSD